MVEDLAEQQQAAAGIQALEDALLVLRRQVHVLRDVIGHIVRPRIRQQVQDLLARHILIGPQVFVKKRDAVAHKCLHPDLADTLRPVGQRLQLGLIALGIGIHLARGGPVQALHHHTADAAVGLPELLAQSADRAHGIDLLFSGHVVRQIFLGREEDQLFALPGERQRRNGRGSLHVKGEEHTRKNRQSAQGDHWKTDSLNTVILHGVSSPFRRMW